MMLEVHDQAQSLSTLFSSSRRLAIAEHFRVPYELDAEPVRAGVERLYAHEGAELLWASAVEDAAGPAPVAASLQAPGGSIPIFARVLADRQAEPLLRDLGGSWSRALAVNGVEDEHLASIWVERDGSVFLPFDPDEVCESYWSER